MQFENSLEFARKLDEQDSLRQFRHKFHIPKHHGKERIYFDGNSLGLQPKSARELVDAEMQHWASLAGDAHFHSKWPWYSYHEILTESLSKLLGCEPAEVVAMNSLSVNLHLMMVSFYRPTRERYKILCEYKAFPSDQYVFESQTAFHGFHPEDAVVEVKPRPGEHLVRHDDIVAAIREHGNSLALVFFGGVNYYTGQLFDMRAITAEAQIAGACAAFDLAHAVGNVPLRLHEWNVDFACWCSYKYLNSGPGGVGGVFIHRRHVNNRELPRFAGWWGYDKQMRFDMKKGFVPIPTAEGWQLSNAPVLSMAAQKAALDIFDEVGIEKLWEKGEQLSNYLIFVLESCNKEFLSSPIEIITPRNAKGCQVSFMVPERGRQLYNFLQSHGVAIGWREPAVIRAAPVPLYNSFEEIWQFGNLVREFLSAS